MIPWRRMLEARRLRAIERIFLASERRQHQGPSLRLTGRGIWVPTPFPVLIALFRATRANGFFGPPGVARRTILDAGTGDGRVLSALAHFEPELDVAGIESDALLCQQATENLESVTRRALVRRPERLRLGRGDYRRADTYESLGIRLREVAFILNYPDGNQEDLERFVIRLAPEAKLCLLTHDHEVRLHDLRLVSKEPIAVEDPNSGWHFSVYST